MQQHASKKVEIAFEKVLRRDFRRKGVREGAFDKGLSRRALEKGLSRRGFRGQKHVFSESMTLFAREYDPPRAQAKSSGPF